MKNPFSIKNVIEGVIITVIGGIVLAFILQNAWFSAGGPQVTQAPNDYNQSGGQMIEVVVTPTLPPPTEDTACKNAPQKRLKVGDTAIVCTASDAVLLRSGPRRDATSIEKLSPGKRMMVIGGPTCDENVSGWYWEVRTDSGASGWIADGGDDTDKYFICPTN